MDTDYKKMNTTSWTYCVFTELKALVAGQPKKLLFSVASLSEEKVYVMSCLSSAFSVSFGTVLSTLYWVTQKLPQICTVILRIYIGKVA